MIYCEACKVGFELNLDSYSKIGCPNCSWFNPNIKSVETVESKSVCPKAWWVQIQNNNFKQRSLIMICDRCKIQYNHREGFSPNCPNCGLFNPNIETKATNEPPQKTENEKLIETLQGMLICYEYINKQLKELDETKDKKIIELRELVFAKTEDIESLKKALYEANNRA